MEQTTGTYRDLIVWQRGYGYVLEVYKLTKNFPKHELYGVVSQLRRASSSVLANIVEGQAKNSKKDFVRFLYIARGSIRECEFFLELSRDLGYLTKEQYEHLESMRGETGFLLHRLIKSLEKKV